MSTNIKVKHTLIDETSIINLLKGYNLGPISRCSFLTRGLNDTYIITTKKSSYIFRVYRHRWRNKAQIQFELDAITHLHEKNFQASFPIVKSNGAYICKIDAPEGLRYGVLFSYSKGERPEINTENAQNIGASLGNLHNLIDDFQSDHDRGFTLKFDHLLNEPVALISPVVHKFFGSEVDDAMKDIVENMKVELADMDLEIGFCHGDFYNHNMHVHEGELEVFDFDCAAMGFRAYDIAVSWWNLLTNFGQQEEECWDAFLNGYSRQRTLLKDDFKSLPLFITARRFWLLGTMLQNDDVWGTNWVNKKSLELFILQIKTDNLKSL